MKDDEEKDVRDNNTTVSVDSDPNNLDDNCSDSLNSRYVSWKLAMTFASILSVIMAAMWTVSNTAAHVIASLRDTASGQETRIKVLEGNSISVDDRILHERRHSNTEKDVSILQQGKD